MNKKEFDELKKCLEAGVNEAIKNFNDENHLDNKLKEGHLTRLTNYFCGVNEVLRIIANKNSFEYKSFIWPVYERGYTDYSEVKIS